MAHKLKIGYAFQTTGIDMREGKAAQNHIFHVIQALQHKGHQVTFISPQGKSVLFTRELTKLRDGEAIEKHLRQLPLTGSLLFRLFERLIRKTQTLLKIPYFAFFDALRVYEAILHLENPDLIYERYNLQCLGAALAARRLGIPYVLEVNGDMLAEYEYQGTPVRGLQKHYAQWSTRYILQNAQAIISPTQGLAKHFQDTWHVPDEKLFVIPNATNVEDFLSPDESVDWKQKLNLSPTDLVAMFIGGFYRWHGLEVIVDAFVQANEKFPETKLVLVGDGAARSELECKVSERKLDKHIFFSGAVPSKQVPALAALADLFIYASPGMLWGLAPLKLFEYMAAGKAIVAQNLNGISDFVEDGYSALLVEPNNVAALSDGIARCFGDPELRARLGKNAQELALARHSWVQHVAKLENIYYSLLSV